MTQIDKAASGAQGFKADKIILGVLAALILGALTYVMSQRQQELRRSPIGLDGLQVWLSSNGQNAQSFAGGWRLNADEIGFLIIPLYDTDLNTTRDIPKSQEELIFQQDEYDLTVPPIRAKATEIPTMIVLPKWRSGMRLTQFAHPILLVKRTRLEALLRDLLGPQDVKVSYADKPFSSFPTQSGQNTSYQASIYAAQTFSASGCTPIVGTERAMILGSCPMTGDAVGKSIFVLSDPDLINNHGLLHGDNAFFIRDFVAQVANAQRVIIDYSRDSWLSREKDPPKRDRTWSDLMGFFAPPFTLMWAGFVFATALTLWRAALRFGPLIKEQDGLGASKLMAIGARARLMRLSNSDGALVNEYSKARLAATATAIFGAVHARQLSGSEAFLGYTKRQHPRHAAALAEALNNMRMLPDGASSAQAMTAAADLDRILEKISHDT